MADLIDRQKVLSLPRLTHRTLSGEIVAEYISVADIEALPEEPSAEPEMILCKNCKYWLDIDDGRQKHRMCADAYGDWFCADAERRIDGVDR